MGADKKQQNSIRHNLSLHKRDFRRIHKNGRKEWAVVEEVTELELFSAKTAAKKGTAASKSTGRARNKVKIVDDETIESIASEENEVETTDDSEEEEESVDDRKISKKDKAKALKSIQPRERSTRAKKTAAKPVKYQFSGSESSEFSAESNDEDWD